MYIFVCNSVGLCLFCESAVVKKKKKKVNLLVKSQG